MKENITIEVVFYEATNQEPFATSNIPLDKLPETFEIDTMLHIGDSNWKIIDAKPLTKSSFIKEGKVKLFLEKQQIKTIDPKNLLYSLPTINDEIPNVIDSDNTEDVLVLMEDDWRQTEYVSLAFAKEIDQEFSSILNIYENEKEHAGFKNMHIRKIITQPLKDKNILIKNLEKYFQLDKHYQAVGFETSNAIIENGFAFSTISHWILWGQVTENNSIYCLNLIPMKNALIEPFSSQMDTFLKKEQLLLVDWTRMFIAGENQNPFKDFMSC